MWERVKLLKHISPLVVKWSNVCLRKYTCIKDGNVCMCGIEQIPAALCYKRVCTSCTTRLQFLHVALNLLPKPLSDPAIPT